MNYTIIPTRQDYLDGFWAVLDNVARERLYVAFLEGPPMKKFSTFVLHNIQQDAPQFLALVGGKVVGWCDIGRIERPIHAHCGTLGMGVLKDHRGQGIGKALIQKALEKAWASGFTRIELTVREANVRALEFYKKMGFYVEGVKRKGVRMDGIYEDLICMGLLLEE